MSASSLATARPLPKPDTPDAVRAQLHATLDEIETALVPAREQARPVLVDASIGRLSRQDAIQQQAIALNRVRALEVHREQVRAALQRIDDGTYGTCVGCEEPIEPNRLRARPEAPRCLRCQG